MFDFRPAETFTSDSTQGALQHLTLPETVERTDREGREQKL